METHYLLYLILLDLVGFGLIVYFLYRISVELTHHLQQLTASIQNLERRLEPLMEDTTTLVRDVRKDLDSIRGAVSGLLGAVKFGAVAAQVIQAGLLEKILGFLGGSRKPKKSPEPAARPSGDEFQEE